jgi:hypothetical protein
MDMAMRSFVLAAALALLAAAGMIGWSVLSGTGFSPPWSDGGSGLETGVDQELDFGSTFDDRGGSLYDEFGESDFPRGDSAPGLPGRVVIRSSRAGSAFEPAPPTTRTTTATATATAPRFDWSGGSTGADISTLSRETAADRVEADCRIRGGSSYGCRCLVRLARRDLSEAGFNFLSLANEPEPRGERLQAAGLEARDLGALAGQLVVIDVEARRRCGASLAP